MATPATTPIVSVILPVFNASKFLAQALGSICSQEFADFEVLAFDDASTDDSWDILQRFRRDDPRVVTFQADHNRGYCAHLVDGIARSRGDFVARMDADDVAHPSRFKRQIEYLRRNDRVACVGSYAQMIDDAGRSISRMILPTDHNDIDSFHLARHSSAIVHPSAMMRRDALLQVGGYRPTFEPAEDLDLWLRLAEIGLLANIPENLMSYRVHTSNVSLKRSAQQVEQSFRAIHDCWIRRGRVGPEPREFRLPHVSTRSEMWWNWSRAALRDGYDDTARFYARSLFFERPLSFRRMWLALACEFAPFARLGRRISGVRVGEYRA